MRFFELNFRPKNIFAEKGKAVGPTFLNALYKGFEIDRAVEKLARDALKNLGSINFSGNQFHHLPAPVQLVAPLQMSLPPFSPSIGPPIRHSISPSISQKLEKRFIVNQSGIAGIQAVYVPVEQTHEEMASPLTPQQQNEQNKSENMFKQSSLLGKYKPPSGSYAAQNVQSNVVPVSATFEKSPQNPSQAGQSAWSSLNWSNAAKTAKIDLETNDQPVSTTYNQPISQPLSQPISQAMKQPKIQTYPADILLSFIKPACESTSAKVATKFIKLYQQQHHCHYLQHKLFYKSPNGGVTSNLTNSSLLSIHSERFRALFTVRSRILVRLPQLGHF